MAQCGDKPKRSAIGVAPLGIISIGIVPMGVVAGFHAMGIWSLTQGSSHQHHSSGGAQQQLLAYPSRQVALPWATSGCRAQSIQRNIPHTNTDS
jgi:hypothetical protein